MFELLNTGHISRTCTSVKSGNFGQFSYRNSFFFLKKGVELSVNVKYSNWLNTG